MSRILRTLRHGASRPYAEVAEVRARRRACRVLFAIVMMATLFLLAVIGLLVSSHEEPAAPRPVKVVH